MKQPTSPVNPSPEPADTELLIKTEEESLTNQLRGLLEDYFSLSEDEDTHSPEDHDAVVVDYHFYQDNLSFFRELNSENHSFFNPLVLIAKGAPASVLPEYPVDTFHEIHDVSDEASNLSQDLKPLLAVRKLTKNLARVSEESESDSIAVQNATRKRYKEFIYQFQTRMEELNESLFDHSRRTATFATILADELGWTSKQRENLYIATLLHDIGKMAIPDPILYKPGSLTEAEFNVVKDHPSRGFECLPDSDNQLMKMTETVTRHHHEKWDGTGYPNGLKGKEIPLSARIVSITDVFDALTHDRVYRDKMQEEKALNLIRDNRGSHFDPELVDLFFEVLPRLRTID